MAYTRRDLRRLAAQPFFNKSVGSAPTFAYAASLEETDYDGDDAELIEELLDHAIQLEILENALREQ